MFAFVIGTPPPHPPPFVPPPCPPTFVDRDDGLACFHTPPASCDDSFQWISQESLYRKCRYDDPRCLPAGICTAAQQFPPMSPRPPPSPPPPTCPTNLAVSCRSVSDRSTCVDSYEVVSFNTRRKCSFNDRDTCFAQSLCALSPPPPSEDSLSELELGAIISGAVVASLLLIAITCRRRLQL